MLEPLRKKYRASQARLATKKLLKEAIEVQSIADSLSEADDKRFTHQVSSVSDKDVKKRIALAVAAAERSLGLKAFDEQIAGALVLNRRSIAEMQTGEGKTLTAAIGAAAKALAGHKVHIATVNDYLAGRDAETMRPFYKQLGLTVGHAGAAISADEKRQAYRCDVVYATAQELAFDYLRDHLIGTKKELVQGHLEALIVDEADSILIDEAGTPLILSGAPEADGGLYEQFATLTPLLTEGIHFHLDRKDKYVDVTDDGTDLIESWLNDQGMLPDGVGLHDARGLHLVHAVTSSIAAQSLYTRDIDYMVRGDQILIVDEHTGRTLVGRRWSDGLHQAIEAKEGLMVRAEAPTLASITFQGFMQQYTHLCGLTGTAASESDEFAQHYQLKVEVIPTHRPIQRVDDYDRVYLTNEARNKAVIDEVKAAFLRRQPVLIGTDSVESSEAFAKLLQAAGVNPKVLNARQHASEADIIAEAGRPGAVTIATQMAGRGTDILLGGNLENALNNAPAESRFDAIRERWSDDFAEVVNAGGLYVIGTTRAPSRRVDQQLRGRAGRQGDPGRSCFFLSLEDDFVKLYAGEKLKGLMSRLEIEGNDALEGKMMDRIIRQAQEARETVDRESRIDLLKYDHVLNEQRAAVYAIREHWLHALEGEQGEADRNQVVQRILKAGVEDMVRKHIPLELLTLNDWDSSAIRHDIAKTWNIGVPEDFFKPCEDNASNVTKHLLGFAKAYYDHRKTLIRPEVLPIFEQVTILEGLDKAWQIQQRNLVMLRDGIQLRSFANENPRHAYQREAAQMFGDLLEQAHVISAHVLLGARIPARPIQQAA